MRHGSLFSGIGGFDCAASWVGWENSFHTEIDPFCRIILKHHFPNATTYTEIRNTDFTPWRNQIDVLSGGFPCPPFSQAGKRKGTADDRYLWPEMFRAIREIQPRWIVAENVLGIVNWNEGVVFEQVHLDLEAEGYSVQTFVLPACGINAPHQRYRTWFVAHRDDDQLRAGLPFEQWSRSATVAESSPDVRYTYRDGTGAQCGISGEPSPESGGGRFRSGQDGSRAAAHTSMYGYEMWPESHAPKDCPKDGHDIFIGPARPGVQRPAADAQSGGFQRGCSESGRPEGNKAERPNFLNGIEGSGIQWTSAHTHYGGMLKPNAGYASAADRPDGGNPQSTHTYGQLPQCGNGQRPQGRGFERVGTESFGGTFCWQDFPTQSPVCGRDDGLSNLLHGITFPRWRKESVKAYGNAIVPQLAYRIFRVIDYMSDNK